MGQQWSILLVLAVCASVCAQGSEPQAGSPLPLEVGNRWVMGVSSDGEPVVFAEVTGVVGVKQTSSDTAYTSFSDALDESGEQYFVLRIVDYMRLFPIDPDTAVVRMDESGSIWCRAVVDREDGLTKVASTEQPWLMVDGRSTWQMRIDDDYYSIQFSLCGDGSGYVDFSRRYVDSPGSGVPGTHHLLQICGEMNGRVWISEGGSSSHLVLLTGIGPVWIPLPTTETELRGLHWELREANLGGRTVVPRETAVAPQSWGEVKTEQ